MLQQSYVCVPPPIETLLEEANGLWLEKLFSHHDFNQQIKSQKDLLQLTRDIFSALPLHMTLAEGVAQGFVTEAAATNLYTLLAFQLERDEVQKRLSLYLPFELLSPVTTGSQLIQWASVKFQTAYRLAWEAQLSQHEVRANYVDGDVLEPELRDGDHPRVVKAAHLIPGLLQVGHLTADEVIGYVQRSKDLLLTNSILTACEVAVDLGLMKHDVVKSANYAEQTSSLSATGMTKNRARWLTSVAKEKALIETAEAVAQILESGAHVSNLLSHEELLVAIEAVRLACLSSPTVYNCHREWLNGLMNSNQESQVRDGLIKLTAHLHAKGLINDEDLRYWGITLPHLGGPFYQNRHRLQPTIATILSMCEKTAEHSQLSKLVYPVALILGSRIKGYGLAEADCDIAIFVRPGVDRSQRQYIEDELLRIYDHERFDGNVKLLWLYETHGHLGVIDWSKLEASDYESSWIYVLFGALWFGEKEQISMLHQLLLTSYFTPPNTELNGKPAYEYWLEEMERDTLQYRLLHKGFGRFYPVECPMNTKHGSGIDGHSAFYDPKYRRIATELFLRRVFLPQL